MSGSLGRSRRQMIFRIRGAMETAPGSAQCSSLTHVMRMSWRAGWGSLVQRTREQSRWDRRFGDKVTSASVLEVKCTAARLHSLNGGMTELSVRASVCIGRRLAARGDHRRSHAHALSFRAVELIDQRRYRP
jgi:hypothetical protein